MVPLTLSDGAASWVVTLGWSPVRSGVQAQAAFTVGLLHERPSMRKCTTNTKAHHISRLGRQSTNLKVSRPARL
jgi:hypothetical protein